jgi:amino acid transporter
MPSPRTAPQRVGVRVVLFAALASVGLLLVASGLMTSGYGFTGITSLIPVIAAVFVTLLIFVRPYVAMTSHTRSSGAMYAIVNEALGPAWGVPVAYIAIVAYNMLQIALYGLLGAQLQQVLAPGANLPWWAYALCVWAVVTGAGLLTLSKAGYVLTVLAGLEIVVVGAVAWRGLTSHASGALAHALFPGSQTLSQESTAIAVVVLAFIGFETTLIYAREVESPRSTISRATYLAIILPAIAFAATAWAMQARWGGQIATVAANQGPEAFFGLAGHHLDEAGNDILVFSVGAALIAYAAGVMRYSQAAAYKGMLPRALTRSTVSGVPFIASLVQSALGLVTILIAAALHWSALKFFFTGGTVGGDGILLLLVVTSGAMGVFFHRHLEERAREGRWTAVIAPWLAMVMLGGGLALANWHFDLNLGEPGDPAARLWPLTFVVVAVTGVGWVQWTKRRRPEQFERLRDDLVPETALEPEPKTTGGAR